MTGWARLRLGLIVVSTLVIQLAVLDDVTLFHTHPDALLLVAVAGGLVGGPQRGAVVGFLAGLAADLFLATPFGLSALAFTLVGFGVGMARASLIQPAWWLTPVTGALASAAGVVVYALLSATVGQYQVLGDRLVVVVGVVALANGVLALVVVPMVRWALGSGLPPRAATGSLAGPLVSSVGRFAPRTLRARR